MPYKMDSLKRPIDYTANDGWFFSIFFSM